MVIYVDYHSYDNPHVGRADSYYENCADDTR
jgi:hypothetical protein